MIFLPNNRNKKYGFSLIELSIVLVIVGLLSAAAVTILGSRLDTEKYNVTKEKIEVITEALNRFYAANSRLPCPAQGTLKLGDSDFGQSIYSSGTGVDKGCDISNPSNTSAIADNHATNTPAGTSSVDVGGGKWIRQGTVPTRTLGLADAMMYDGYGNKFTYAVTEKFTSNAVNGSIVINDGISSSPVTTSAAFIIVSHGKDAKGAYSSAGTIGVDCNLLDGKDKENCDRDAVFTETQTNDLQRDSVGWYDDITGWEDRNAVIGLLAQATQGLSIKFTLATYNANLGGVVGANTKCALEYPGYTFCNFNSDLTTYGAVGGLPNTSTYFTSLGWVDGDNNTCSSWNGTGSVGDVLSVTSGAWSVSPSANCSDTIRIACCYHY